MWVLPGKLEHVQQLIAHLFPSLKYTTKCQLLQLQKAALTIVAHTHSFNDDWMRCPCSEHKAKSFGPFDQGSFIWWRGLVDDLVALSLWDHRVAHCHHCQELADLRWCRLNTHTTRADTVIFGQNWLQIKNYEKSFRDTYMVLLNVLDESWVVKLSRVIAAGRQIAVRQEIYEGSYFSYSVRNIIFLAFKCYC